MSLFHYLGFALSGVFTLGKLLGYHDWDWKWIMVLLAV